MSRLIEFNEFRRLREDRMHYDEWHTAYTEQTKEHLLNELLNQQDEGFPLKKGSSKDKKKFEALTSVLEEKSTTSWLKEILKTLRIQD